MIKIQINHDKSILIKRLTLVGNSPLLTSDTIDFLKVFTQKCLACWAIFVRCCATLKKQRCSNEIVFRAPDGQVSTVVQSCW